MQDFESDYLYFGSNIQFIHSDNEISFYENSGKLVIVSTSSRIKSYYQFIKFCVDFKFLIPGRNYSIFLSKEGIFIKSVLDNYTYIMSLELNIIHEYPKDTLSISNDCQKCLFLKRGKLYFHELDTKKEISIEYRYNSNISCTWSNNSKKVALVLKDQNIHLINSKGTIQHVFEQTSDSIFCFFNFNSNYIIVGYRESIKVFNTSSGKLYCTKRFTGIITKHILISSFDNTYITCVKYDDFTELKLCSINGKELSCYSIKSGIKNTSLSKDFSKLAISYGNEIIIYKIWNNNIDFLYSFSTSFNITSLNWSLDSTYLYYICTNIDLSVSRLILFNYSKMNDYIDNVLLKPPLLFLEELELHPLLIRNHPCVQESLQYFGN